ncbi:MAG: hypothetical protein K2P86_11215 [Xanthobacteraceae bacterium]|nr:hypothetical protein [Xanthobacteraceae bacterium]
MTNTKKIVTGAVAAIALAVAGLSAAGSTSAEAGWKHKHHWNKHYYGFHTVAPLAYYGYHNNCGWRLNHWGHKVYVCF